jgi:prepilin-type N-terminal cleavage/methylation domain-containing protein
MKTATTTSRRRGLSLSEMLTVVSILGVLAAIAVPIYSNTFANSESAIAGNTLETLNAAVHSFNEINYELVLNTADSGGQNELAILHTLQYRSSTNPSFGSPYMTPTWSPTVSSSTKDFRLVWKGTLYTLVSPGTSGTGLKVGFDGTDFGTSYGYPSGYTTVGH